MDDLQNVALGRTPPDRVVRGGRVLTPGTRSLEARDVLVSGGRIAAVVEDGSTAIGDETEVIDAEGQVVVPGFVDAHTHLDVEQAYETAYHLSLRGGTTTVVTEVQDLGVLFGADAVEAMLDATAGLPVSVLATVPPQPLIDTFGESWADERETRRLCDLLARDRVVGVGEIDWIHVVGRDSPVEELIDRARTEHAPVSAHGAGCSGEKLAALAALVDNDHEAISADGIVERVENGIHAIGRTGAIRDDSEAISDAYDRVEPADLSLSSDGIACRTLLEAGHMDAVLRRVIDAGVPPLDAIHMATAVPARHFGLPCGVIAPGRPADLVVLSDLESVAVDTVLSGGEVVVRAGDALVGPRRHEYPLAFYDSVTVDVDASRFEVPDPGGPVRAIRYEGGLLSSETVVEPPREDGALSADPARDLCKATVIDRHPDGDGRGFTGFVTGFGIERGAVATTLSWEVPGLLVVGTDDDAMRRAACRVRELRGGWAVVEEGAVAADLPMPVGGYAATLPIEETADRLDAVRAAIRALGSDVEAAMIGIQTLTFPGVPSLKLSPSGYADIRHRRIVGLAVE